MTVCESFKAGPEPCGFTAVVEIDAACANDHMITRRLCTFCLRMAREGHKYCPECRENADTIAIMRVKKEHTLAPVN